MTFLVLHLLSYDFSLPVSVITMSIYTGLSTKKMGWGDLQFLLLQRDQENFEDIQLYHSHGRRLTLHAFSQGLHPMLWLWRKLKCWRRKFKSKHALYLMVWRQIWIQASSVVIHIRLQWYWKRWKERMRWCTPNSAVLLATFMAELCTIVLHFSIWFK